MRLIVLAMALGAACGASDPAPTPFDPGACGSSWYSYGQRVPVSCDRECATKPANYDGSGADATFCYASRPDSSEMSSCDRSFVDGDGVRGCCRSYVIDPAASTDMIKWGMHFYECE